MKSFSKPHIAWLLPLLLSVVTFSKAHAQATVSYPFGIGRSSSCGTSSGSHEVHFYNYNGTANTISTITTNTGTSPVRRYAPELRIGASGSTIQRFTSSYSSVSFNPSDHNIYYVWTATSGTLAPGGVKTSYIWKWPVGTQPTSTLPRLNNFISVPADLLGIAFDNDGNAFTIEFSDEPDGVPHSAYIRSINLSTGTLGPRDNLILTGGATIYKQGSGDVAMSPSGQMFFVVDNKLFTPNYKAYTGTGANITCTYIDTVVNAATGDFVGLTYADGKTVSAYSGGGCPFYETNMLSAGTSEITKQNTVYQASDMASVVSGIGTAKRLVSYTPTGVAGQYNVVYDIYVKNYGNMDVSNVQITDDLSVINGSGNVSNVTTAFVGTPPAGIARNTSYNGTTNRNLLTGTGTLPNYPVANNNFTIRITCRLSNIIGGKVYNNSATASAVGFNNIPLTDISTNGTSPDLNGNDKPDDAGEDQPTPLLVAVASYTPPCASLVTTLYKQDFGTGTTNTTTIPAATPGSLTATTSYTGSTTQPLAVERYMLTNNANNADNVRFISLNDHTGDANGRMLVINADVASTVMYRGTVVTPSCANQQYSLIFYAAFVGNASYQTVCNGFGGFKYPRIKMRVRDAATNLIITEATTADITGTSWAQYGMKWNAPASYTSVIIELINDAPGGCGNDVALDDIQFGLCSPLPTVAISNTPAGCISSPASFSSSLSDPGVIVGAPQYQWQVSTDVTGTTYNNIVGATAATYTIGSVAEGDVDKRYRLLVAASGNIITPGCQYASSEKLLAAKTLSSGTPTIAKSKTSSCAGEAISLKASGVTLGTNAVYKWYTVSCGGTPAGTGPVLTVNPAATTTYYVRAEGDCGNTLCGSITITPGTCDIDDDNDGITDLAENGGLDAEDDNDFDGIPNYKDADFCALNPKGVCTSLDADGDGIINSLDLDSDNDGIPDVVESRGVDANGDGLIDNYLDTDNDGLSQNVDANNTGPSGSGTGLGILDLDGDGVPNFLDLDSDNDGIPDVREAGGTDANNDGMVDGFTDTDNDGFSDNVDGDVGNDGVAENAANTLLRTGIDINNDGRADSYPYKNKDGDGKANPYDLDSDGDGITDVREAGFADANTDGKIDGTYTAKGWSTTVSALGTLSLLNTDTDPAGKTYPDYLDIDSDNDGIPDNIEGQPTASYVLPSYLDSDGDGIDNSYDDFSGFGGSGINPVNTDGDAQPDYIDGDSDGDGAIDRIEGNDFNRNNKQDDLVTLLDTDLDGDGLDDRFDADNTTAHGTSAFMGNGGSFTGPALPGSRTMVQQTYLSRVNRDWRDIGFVLDVNFVAVKAALHDEQVRVDWTVVYQKDIAFYSVERSIDGNTFRSLKTVEATTAENYTITDTVSGVNASVLYYRIRAVAHNGNGGYSRTSAIQLKKNSHYNLAVFPNPANRLFQMRLYAITAGPATFTVSTIEGRQVARFIKQVAAGFNTFVYQDLGRLPDGVYMLQMSLQGSMQHVRFVVQH